MTMSTSFRSTTSAGSRVRWIPATSRVASCAFASVRVPTQVMRIGRPALRSISSPLRASTVHTPRPTVPMPSKPTWIGFTNGRRSSETVFAEHLLDAANRLTRARLVLDHCEAHMIVAVFAEADAGRHRNLRPREQLLGELERALLA